MPKFLTTAQIEKFHTDGYVAPLRVISPERAAAIRQQLEDFEKTNGPLMKVARFRPHMLLTCIRDLVREERIIDAVEDLFGPNILVWSSDFLIKEPRDPGFVSWHQDSNYWGLSSPDVVTAWVALSESDEENGAMKVIPGTHQEKALPHRDTFAKENILTRGQEIAVDVDPGRAKTLELKAGEMSLHHVGIVHGSEPNRSNRRRFGFAIRYIPTYVRQLDRKASASLVRGFDEFKSFESEPVPTRDMDPVCVAFRETANKKALAANFVAKPT